MLQFIRGTVGSWIVKGLFVILIFSFGIWGIGDIFRGHGPADAVAEVGAVKITSGELDQEFRQQLSRFRALSGGQLDEEQARKLGLVEQSLQNLIQRHLINYAASDAGITVSDLLVQQRIQDQPAFRNSLGKFEPELFRRVLAANGLNEGTYVSTLRGEIGRQLVVGAIASGAEAPKVAVEALYRFQAEQRVAETLTLEAARIGDVGQPDPAALQQYHEDNAIRFTTPEYRNLTVVTLTADDVARQLELSDDEIRASFESRVDEFVTPEKRSLQQVVVDSREQAQAIVDAIRAGQSLADAAKAKGRETVTLASQSREDLAELGAVAFSLNQGQTSDPVQSPLGWHVLSVTGIEPGHERSLAEVRDTIVADLRREKATDQLYESANRFDDALAGGASLEDAAAKYGFPLAGLKQIDATGALADGTKADGTKVGSGVDLPKLLDLAFNSLSEGKQSPLSEGHNGTYFVVRVDGVTPARLRPLDEVKDQAIAGWQVEERTRRAAAKAKELEEALKAGQSPVELASSSGAVYATTEPFDRRSAKAGALPEALLTKLFDLAPGETASAATATGQVVARLTKVIPADPAAAGTALEPIQRQVSQALAGDLISQYLEALRQRHTVAIHQERLQSRFAPN